MPGQAPVPPGASLGQDFKDAAHRLGLTVVNVSPSQGVLKHGETENTILFDSLRRVWEQSPLERRPAVVESFLRAALSKVDAPERTGFAEARDRLLLRVAHPGYAQIPGADVVAPRWDLVPGHLSVFLVVDEPQTMWTVLEDHLAKWGKTFEQLYYNAIENLRRRTDPNRQRVVPPLPVIRYYQDNDAFDAARLLLLSDFVLPWPRDGVVFGVPTRDHLFFAPVRGKETLMVMEAMIELCDRFIAEGAKPISDQLFWFDGRAFEHIAVTRDAQGTRVRPPERLKQAIVG